MMTTTNFDEILKELRKPFHPSHVTWKPGSVRQDQTRAMALAYADLRAYQNRLDELCGMNWSVTYTPWGDRIVCHLTINGITRSSTGEPDSQSERSEIAGTSAEAQAFKRACAMFGLGRYLYQMPSVWVEYDAKAKQFTPQAKARLEGIIALHYRNACNKEMNEELPNPEEVEPQADDEKPSALIIAERNRQPDQPAAHVNRTRSNEAKEGNEAVGTEKRTQSGPLKFLFEQFDRLGRDLYGEQWEGVCQHNVERITEGKTSNSHDLNAEQIRKLIAGMQRLKRQRREANAMPKINPVPNTPVINTPVINGAVANGPVANGKVLAAA